MVISDHIMGLLIGIIMIETGIIIGNKINEMAEKNESTTLWRLFRILFAVLCSGVFLVLLSFLALSMFQNEPNNNITNTAIAITTGVISGFFILLFQRILPNINY
jgi:sterol desaturase/sphingolipid hydroxylase (fatty acid hydroxylase superfamily)